MKSTRSVIAGLLLVLTGAGLAMGAKWLVVRNAETPRPAALVAAARTTDRLIETMQRRLASGPEDARAYGLLGAAYLQKARETAHPGYYALAEEAMDRALTMDAQDFEALAGNGSLALSRHQFEEAVDWAERARQVNPHAARVYGIAGDANAELGRYPEAFAAFQQMVDLRPDLSSYSRVSYARELTGDMAGAVEAMQRAAAAGAPNAEGTSWVRVQLGHLYFRSGELQAAEREYRRAQDAFPGYVHAAAGLARVQAARGDHEGAIRLYEDVIDRVPLLEYVIALGEVYRGAGLPGEAAKMHALVGVQEQLYRSAGVNTDLEMALYQADEDDDVLLALERARREYRRRRSIWAADVLAWTLYKNGDYAEAAAASREALRLGTRDALMHYHAGMIAHRLERRDEARQHLEQALAINPYFSIRHGPSARQTLRELQETPPVAMAQEAP